MRRLLSVDFSVDDVYGLLSEGDEFGGEVLDQLARVLTLIIQLHQ